METGAYRGKGKGVSRARVSYARVRLGGHTKYALQGGS